VESLGSKTVPELKDMAKAAGVPKYGSMNKGELIAALSALSESATQDEADKLVSSGEAEIPAESIVQSSSSNSDLENHPKFAKFKTGGKP